MTCGRGRPLFSSRRSPLRGCVEPDVGVWLPRVLSVGATLLLDRDRSIDTVVGPPVDASRATSFDGSGGDGRFFGDDCHTRDHLTSSGTTQPLNAGIG